MAQLQSPTGKRVALWGGALIVLGGLVLALAWSQSQSTKPQPSSDSAANVPAVTERDHVKGNAMATSVLIEYSDFQCPACKAYYPVVSKIADELGTKVQVAYRNYPLSQLHKNARTAASAAEAAGKQGKFWEMHDVLFINQEKWSESKDVKRDFSAYAKAIGLSVEQFTQDLSDKTLQEKIDADLSGGTAAGVQGTPTFFLNRKKLESTPPNYEQFKERIEESVGKP